MLILIPQPMLMNTMVLTDHPNNRQWIILKISFLTISADAAAFVNVVEDTSAILSKVVVGFKLREASKTLSACLIRFHCSMSSLNLVG